MDTDTRQRSDPRLTLSDRLLRETAWTSLDKVDADALVEAKTLPPDAVPTPFPSWNLACRDEGGGVGIARGWHVTVGAGSGKGKSLLGGALAASAMLAGERVGLVSLEMSQAQLDTRQLAIISGLPVRELEQGASFREDTLRRALARTREIAETKGGRVFRSPDVLHGIEEIEGAITFLRNGPARCRFFVVDYLQLAGDPNDPSSITAVSHRIRQLARDLDVVTVCLSQFNRDVHRRGTAPGIHDLMGSSAIENDSDQVVILDHTTLERTTDGWTASLRLAKNRHGPSVEIPLHFDSRTLRMRELLPDELPSRRAA